MFKLAMLSLSLAACATTGATLNGEHSPRAKVTLDLAAPSGSDAVFPAALDPTVPTVDRMQHAIRAAVGDTITAELDLCVAPSGAVKHLRLARSSSYEPFDKALLADAAAWQFASLPGPDRVMSCRRATIAYTAH